MSFEDNFPNTFEVEKRERFTSFEENTIYALKLIRNLFEKYSDQLDGDEFILRNHKFWKNNWRDEIHILKNFKRSQDDSI